ncbi:MAG: thiamine phosphate synthase [Phycisphaerales bacterium]|nr:thiamine phosphate synthase [Planctomycetota bacterium]
MAAIYRLIDANFNRAREALRVLEDLARLRLNNAELSRELKSLRHELTIAMNQFPVDRATLLAWRDTPGDVGTKAPAPAATPGRETEAGMAAAAASRLSESLRVLEESAKTLGSSRGGDVAAAAIERIRYRGYDASRRLELALAGGRGPQWSLCVLISESLCVHHRWTEVARRALEGGADCIQLREKGLSDRELLGRAQTLVEFAQKSAAAVVVNDRADIALLSGADGVHIGQTDTSVADVRRIAGSGLRIGVSCSTIEEARKAVQEGADLCGLGPMFPSTTKVKPSLSGPELLSAYLADETTSRVPHLAISGITQANAATLAALGCRGIAVSAAVCGAEKPEDVCRGLTRAIRGLEDVA